MRGPLIHREPANDRERAQRHPETTDLEREAARVIAEEHMPETNPVLNQRADVAPHIPPAVAHVASGLSLVLVGASGFLPSPFNVVAFALGFVAAYLGGVALPQPKFLAASPIANKALLPMLGTLATAFAALADATTGPLHAGLALVGLILSWLAGKMSEQPKAQ